MVFVTGDVHGKVDISKFNTRLFPRQKLLTKRDCVIVCGDFGLVWNNDNEDLYWRKWLNEKPWTTLFLDGNHENFDLLRQFPEERLFGGAVHRIADSIYHLERGEIYEIEGKTYFVMGGAESHDQEIRTEGVSWWPEEIPSDTEMKHALDNLAAHGSRVDVMLTHCAPLYLEHQIVCRKGHASDNPLTNFLQYLSETVSYTQWYCGHYHIDLDVRDDFHVLDHEILQIG